MSKEQWYECIKLQWEFIKRHIDGDREQDGFWDELIADANKTIDSAPDLNREYVKSSILLVLNAMQSEFIEGKKTWTD